MIQRGYWRQRWHQNELLLLGGMRGGSAIREGETRVTTWSVGWFWGSLPQWEEEGRWCPKGKRASSSQSNSEFSLRRVMRIGWSVWSETAPATVPTVSSDVGWCNSVMATAATSSKVSRRAPRRSVRSVSERQVLGNDSRCCCCCCCCIVGGPHQGDVCIWRMDMYSPSSVVSSRSSTVKRSDACRILSSQTVALL